MMRERLEQFGVPQAPRSDGKPLAAGVTRLDAKNPLAGRTVPKRTQTEAEFEAMLREKHPSDAILFEPIKFRLGEKCFYCPDFFVPALMTFFEVKGGHVFEDSVIKFKATKEIHSSWASFEMHQKKDGVWRRIH